MQSMDENKSWSLSSSTKKSGITQSSEDEMVLRRGPWTVEEDLALINYITINGEGRWNSLARCAGLKRTGKSCRLRWLNYLRPDVRRGNITLEEQLMILELHSRWGNRWSKIAQSLPGRTDNEIKNYWRTRVQKHAKQLKCDVNSKQFKDTMRYLWMPRLVERIQAASTNTVKCSDINPSSNLLNSNFTPDNSTNSLSSFSTHMSDVTDYYGLSINNNQIVSQDYFQDDHMGNGVDESSASPNCYFNNQDMEYQVFDNMEQMSSSQHWNTGNLWNVEDTFRLQ